MWLRPVCVDRARLRFTVNAVDEPGVAGAKQDTAKPDKEAIQGEWTVVSGQSRSGSGEIVGESATFSGEKFMYWTGNVKFSATFSLDPSENPKQSLFQRAEGTLDPGTHLQEKLKPTAVLVI
jgi:uncharacterized protein (TIGR03067 family)